MNKLQCLNYLVIEVLVESFPQKSRIQYSDLGDWYMSSLLVLAAFMVLLLH